MATAISQAVAAVACRPWVSGGGAMRSLSQCEAPHPEQRPRHRLDALDEEAVGKPARDGRQVARVSRCGTNRQLDELGRDDACGGAGHSRLALLSVHAQQRAPARVLRLDRPPLGRIRNAQLDDEGGESVSLRRHTPRGCLGHGIRRQASFWVLLRNCTEVEALRILPLPLPHLRAVEHLEAAEPRDDGTAL
eukprot:scaffold10136_cov126-Isochrysis_galbana.AAC.2